MSGSQTYLSGDNGGGGTSGDSSTEYLNQHFQDTFVPASNNTGLATNATINPFGDFFANNALPMGSRKELEFKNIDIIDDKNWINGLPTYKVRFTEDYPHVACYVWGQAYINNWYNKKTLKWYQAMNGTPGSSANDNGILIVSKAKRAWIHSNGPQIYPYSASATFNSIGFAYSTSLDGASDINASNLINYDHYYKTMWGKKSYFIPTSATTASFDLHAWRVSFAGDEINFNGLVVEHFEESDRVVWNPGGFFYNKELKEYDTGATFNISTSNLLGAIKYANLNAFGERRMETFELPYISTSAIGLSGQNIIIAATGTGSSFLPGYALVLQQPGTSFMAGYVSSVAGDVITLDRSIDRAFSGTVAKWWQAGPTMAITNRNIHKKLGTWAVSEIEVSQARALEDRWAADPNTAYANSLYSNPEHATDNYNYLEPNALYNTVISKRNPLFQTQFRGLAPSKVNIGGHVLTPIIGVTAPTACYVNYLGVFNSIDIEVYPTPTSNFTPQPLTGGYSTAVTDLARSSRSLYPASETDPGAISGILDFTVTVNGVSCYRKTIVGLSGPTTINLAKDLPFQQNVISIQFIGTSNSAYGIGPVHYYEYNGVTNSVDGFARYMRGATTYPLGISGNTMAIFTGFKNFIPAECLYSATMSLGTTALVSGVNGFASDYFSNPFLQSFVSAGNTNNFVSFDFVGNGFALAGHAPGATAIIKISGATYPYTSPNVFGLSQSLHRIEVFTAFQNAIGGAYTFGADTFDQANFKSSFYKNSVRPMRYFDGVYPPPGAEDGDIWKQSSQNQKTYIRQSGAWHKMMLGSEVDAVDTDFTYRKNALAFSGGLWIGGVPSAEIAYQKSRSKWQKKAPQQFFNYRYFIGVSAVNEIPNIPITTFDVTKGMSSTAYAIPMAAYVSGKLSQNKFIYQISDLTSKAAGATSTWATALMFKSTCYINAVWTILPGISTAARNYTLQVGDIDWSGTSPQPPLSLIGVSSGIIPYSGLMNAGEFLMLMTSTTFQAAGALHVSGFALD